jgi:hypothetical protein
VVAHSSIQVVERGYAVRDGFDPVNAVQPAANARINNHNKPSVRLVWHCTDRFIESAALREFASLVS